MERRRKAYKDLIEKLRHENEQLSESEKKKEKLLLDTIVGNSKYGDLNKAAEIQADLDIQNIPINQVEKRNRQRAEILEAKNNQTLQWALEISLLDQNTKKTGIDPTASEQRIPQRGKRTSKQANMLGGQNEKEPPSKKRKKGKD